MKGMLVGPLKVEELTKMRHNPPWLWEAYKAKEYDVTCCALQPSEPFDGHNPRSGANLVQMG